MAYVPTDARVLEKVVGFLPLPAAPGLAAHPTPDVARLLRDFAQGRAQNE